MNSYAYLRVTLLMFLLVLFLPQQILAAEWGTGLEVEFHNYIDVIIDSVTEEAKEKGLTEDLIRAKVELQLRRNGITPTGTQSRPEHLQITIGAVDNVFVVTVGLNRTVSYYFKGREYNKIATVWKIGSYGLFGSDISYIFKKLANHLDVFINEYLKVNQQ